MMRLWMWCCAMLTVLTACHRKNVKLARVTPAPHGALYVDESFEPLLQSARQAFEHAYHDTLDLHFVTEREAINKFVSYQTPITIVARRLREDEVNAYYAKGRKMHEFPMAADAVAFVINRNNPDSLLTQKQVIDLLGGKVQSWHNVSSSNASGGVTIVFQNKESGVVGYVRDSLLHAPLPTNCYALETNDEVLNYVKKNTGAIGVLASNRLYDNDDPQKQQALAGLTTLSVAPTAIPDSFYKPIAAAIRYGYYPFSRTVFLVTGEDRYGLGTGFANYLTSQAGMILIQRFGLVPSIEPTRTIELKKSF